MIYILIPETQQGGRSRNPNMDFRLYRRTRPERRIRRHTQRRRRSLQPHEQTVSWFRQEDPIQRHELPVDGEHSTFPSRSQEIRTTRGGNIPNRRFI